MDYVFITGWVHGPGQGGLNQFRFDPETGAMEYMCNLYPETSFGTAFFNKDKNVLYAIEETKDLNGGFVYSFSVDPENGNLTLIGKAYTLAPNPAYIGIDKSGRFAVVADHSFDITTVKIKKDENGKPYTEKILADAAVVLFGINEDGSLGEPIDACVHTGKSIAPRQNMPHPHCAVFSPDGRFCAVCDKGNDYVYMYRVNAEDRKLELVTRWKETPGSKPRYAAWHPAKPFFYHNNEGSGVVDAYSYDDNDVFTKIGEYLTVPDKNEKKFEQQGFCINSQGSMIYNIEKVSATVAAFKIDQDTGALTLVQNIGKEYEWLRGICITADEKYLIATFMNSSKIVVFSIKDDGTLEDTGFEYDCPNCAGIESISI